MLVSDYGSSWNYIDGNLFNDQPNLTFGTSFTPTTGAKSSWVNVLTVTYDCFEITINFNTAFTNANARNIVADIGIDTAGGTNYVPLINDLLCKSTPFNIKTGQTYTFPIFIPAGSSIAVRGQNSVNGVAARCAIMVCGLPSKPDKIVYGHAVETLGITSSVLGTAVTSNNTATFGTYTTIGTTTRRWKAIQMGWAINNATIAALMYRFDLAYGTNDQRITGDLWGLPTTSEQLFFNQQKINCDIPAGIDVKAHIWCSGTGTINQSIALYGVY